MIHSDHKCRFSLEIPDDWVRTQRLARFAAMGGRTAFAHPSGRATLNISCGPLDSRLFSKRNRAEAIRHFVSQIEGRPENLTIDASCRLGEEDNVVSGRFEELGATTGILSRHGLVSAVHGGIEYVIQWVAVPELEEEVDRILASWSFRSSGEGHPSRPEPSCAPAQQPQSMSFPLARLFGTLGFVLAGFGCFWTLRNLLGIDETIEKISEMSGKGIVLFVVSIGIGYFGMLLGQAMGAQLSLTRRRIHTIGILWHFGANGALIWSALSGLSLGLAMGREGAEELTRSIGVQRFGLLLLAAGALIGLFVGWEVDVITSLYGPVRPRASTARLVRLTTVLTCVSAGALQAVLLQIPLLWGVAVGFIIPFVLIPLSLRMIRRDELRRVGQESRKSQS